MAILIGIILYFFLMIYLAYMLYVFFRQMRGREDSYYPPFFPSCGNQKRIIIERISELLSKSDKPLKVLDPGCGCGSILIPLAKKFPQHQFVGIEWDFVVLNITRIRSHKLNNMTLYRDDMFKYSFSDYDIISCFLIEDIMPKFTKKISSDIKSKCWLFSNTFKMVDIEPFEVIKTNSGFLRQNVYIYELN